MSSRSVVCMAAAFIAFLTMVGRVKAGVESTPLNPEQFQSLEQLRNEICDNVLRREDLVQRKEITAKSHVVSIPHVHVLRTEKRPDFKGVIVWTYEGLQPSEGKPLVITAPVYIYDEIEIPRNDLAKLHRDDLVTVIGTVYSYDTHKSTNSERLTVIGIVVPEPR